jgi:hypothetical protein
MFTNGVIKYMMKQPDLKIGDRVSWKGRTKTLRGTIVELQGTVDPTWKTRYVVIKSAPLGVDGAFVGGNYILDLEVKTVTKEINKWVLK